MSVGIAGIRHAFPGKYVHSNEISEAYGFDPEFVTEKLGISGRFLLDEGETVSGLASSAVLELMNDFSIRADEVDLLIVVTQTPDYCLPHTSAIVQDACGLNGDAVVMDLSLGCSGYLLGLETAKALMELRRSDSGILVTVDGYSRILNPEDRNTAPLFGDAATATWLTTNPRYKIGKTTTGSDGSLHQALIVHGSGSTPEPFAPLFMDGRNIFNFALHRVPTDVKRCLSLNGVRLEEIARFVFHQANLFMLNALADRMGIDRQKLALSMSDIGNTTSSSIPIALEREVLSVGAPVSPVLLSGFGVGLSWASTVLFSVEETTC